MGETITPRTTNTHHWQQARDREDGQDHNSQDDKCPPSTTGAAEAKKMSYVSFFFSFTYFVFTKCFRITAKMMNGHHHHYTPSQFPEWTRAQDTFMSWVPLCFYLFIYLLSNDLSLDCVYRMTNRDSRCRWCVSNPCYLFFFFSSFFCYFIVIGSTYLNTSDHHHHYPWQQQQYQGLETRQCVLSLWYVFFFFFWYVFSYYIIIVSTYFDASKHHHYHPRKQQQQQGLEMRQCISGPLVCFFFFFFFDTFFLILL